MLDPRLECGDSLLENLHLDKPLPEQQKQRSYETKTNCSVCTAWAVMGSKTQKGYKPTTISELLGGKAAGCLGALHPAPRV